MVSVLLALVIIDSWIIEDMKFVRPVDHKPHFAKPAGISFLQAQPKPFRSFVYDGTMRTMPNQNSLAMFGLEQVTGYHGNQLRWYNEFTKFLGTPTGLSIANSKFIVTRETIDYPGLELAHATKEGVRIYENKNVLPRGRIVYDYVVVPDPDSSLSLILQPDFDHYKKIVIDRHPVGEIRPPESAQGDSIQFLDSPPDRIRLKVNLSAPGFLALQNSWYPYWKAFEGEIEYRVYRSDFTFMAVELPAGEHLLEFRVENPNYLHARTISEISWILLIIGMSGGIILKFIRRRKGDSKTALSV